MTNSWDVSRKKGASKLQTYLVVVQDHVACAASRVDVENSHVDLPVDVHGLIDIASIIPLVYHLD